MKADYETKISDFFSLARSWYLTEQHTDINVRCTEDNNNKPVFKCHKIIIRKLLEHELNICLDRIDANNDIDELILPDIKHQQFQHFISVLYGFENKVIEEIPQDTETKLPHVPDISNLKLKQENGEEKKLSNHVLDSNGFDVQGYQAGYQAGLKQGERPKEISRTCPYCQKIFKRTSHLTRHLVQHTGEKAHQCNICMKSFARKDKLKIHCKRMHDGEAFFCLCSSIFYNEYEFEEHFETCQSNPSHTKETKRNGNVKMESKKESDQNILNTSNESEVFQHFLNSCMEEGEGEMEQKMEDGLEVKTEVEDQEFETDVDYINDMNVGEDKQNRENKKPSRSRTNGGPCPVCHKVFLRQDHLTRHMATHSGQKPHQCALCSTSFSRKDKLKLHYERVHGGQVFSCSCSNLFKDESELKKHIESNPDHLNKSFENKTPTKSKVGSPIKHNLQHSIQTLIESQHGKESLIEPGNKIFEMEDTEGTQDPSINTIHSEINFINHSKPKKKSNKIGKKKASKIKSEGKRCANEKSKCDYCDMMFESFNSKKAHYIGCHYDLLKDKGLLYTQDGKIQIKRHLCSVEGCDKAYRDHGEIVDHINVVHKNIKNYVCDICSKAFRYKKTLSQHMDVSHVRKKETIMCVQCGDIFNSKAALSNHVACRHKIKVYRFQCRFCDYKTYAKPQLVEHERSHTGEKPEICQWCGKGFNAKVTLRNHERLHTGEKPFKCKVCTSAFAQRTSLKVHMNSHHKDWIKEENNLDGSTILVEDIISIVAS